MVEQPVPVDGGVVLEDLDGGEGKCMFLQLSDGRGWVLDREPGHEMCYKLFEPVDELWIYDPDNGKPMAIRESPFIEGQQTDHRLQPGEKFSVTEIQAQEENGSTLYLRLADGRGWAYDQKNDDEGMVYGGEVMCRRILDEMWEYRPTNGQPISVRAEPDIYGNKTSLVLSPGDTFEVEEILTERDAHPDRDSLPDDYGDGILFLKIVDGQGWLFDKNPELGTMCFRVS